MKAVIRTDSSLTIGSGHLMRCLTLAETVRAVGAEVSFICRELPGNLCDLVQQRGFNLHRLRYKPDSEHICGINGTYAQWLGVPSATDAQETAAILAQQDHVDWLIVDHYALDEVWESRMRSFAANMMVIDDLANRAHNCDLLLDQNLFVHASSRYRSLVPEKCRRLLGPSYALLRDEFLQARARLANRDGKVRRMHLFFGGMDAGNQTGRVIDALRSINRDDIEIDIVVGAGNRHGEALRTDCRDLPQVTLHYHVSNMAELMSKSDLAIGAGGTSTWERCCLGLPSAIVAVAENQVGIGQQAEQAGFAEYLGRGNEVTVERWCATLTRLLDEPALLKAMGRKAARLVDGLGVTRVVESMMQRCLNEVVA
ncbi:MAG TPA: UDP-2,4-diacetamido-2,4,6-trideoxy-beta-L-altropyranose hydrolase [Candidatus Deferrimicrobium sp.]|nr:UDP-2,4-diacetamido-2,4,6-trideoxy-beta-L-altropyranose hydrolase [Candidatus Deferrimicrobium sp.]